MADDNKNLAGEGERTSILPQSEPQVADQTEVLPTHVSQAQTAQLPPVTQQEGAGAFAGTPLESVAESSTGVQVGDEAVAGGAAAVEPASTKASWGKRAAIAGAAAAILSVGFGAGILDLVDQLGVLGLGRGQARLKIGDFAEHRIDVLADLLEEDIDLARLVAALGLGEGLLLNVCGSDGHRENLSSSVRPWARATAGGLSSKVL